MIATLNPHLPTIHKLDHGLTIIAQEMPVDAVNLNIWLNIGSAREHDKINGMAHFLEHMVFKGTSNLGIGEFEQRIEAKGAVTNAATSQDYTHYYITTAPQDFADLAPLQIDVVLNPKLPKDAFNQERSVVLEEIRRAQDNPRRRVYQRSIELAFDSLPYRRPVLGPESVITDVRVEEMRDFHSTYYQPSAMTAVAVGNLPVEELIAIVEDGFNRYGRNFSGLSQPDQRLEAEAPFKEVIRREYIDDSLQQARLVLLWRVPGWDDLTETYGLDILAAILSQGRMSRLIRELREERQLVNQIGVSNISFLAQGVFYIAAQLPTENIPEVESRIVEILASLHEELVTEAEIQRVSRQVANRFIFGNETPSDRANLYGYYYALFNDLNTVMNYPEIIRQISDVDLRNAAKSYLDPQSYGVVVFKPE